MDTYWFTAWLKANRVTGEASLRRTLGRRGSLDSFINSAPPPQVLQRHEPPALTELTAGKGIDLTGALGCHHIDCLTRELNGLFRHAWHYFDRIILPDQALFHVVAFQRHGNLDRLIEQLLPFILLLRSIGKDGANELVRFETRLPGCRKHFKDHAREAAIDQAFTNLSLLAKEIASSAEISSDDHLTVRRDVALSDMYFLWKAHRH